jgi:hypothetical protein
MRPIPEAADVTEADRLQCRTLIEAASFSAVDYEDDGACWERVLPSGDCLVLAVWKSALCGKPERKEWILVRYTGHGTLGDETDPMTLHEALCRVAALTADDKKRRIRPASRSRG